MDVWIWVSTVALFIVSLNWATNVIFRDREKMENLRKKLTRMKEKGSYDEEVLKEATTVMNKILLRRILISILVIIPLWWVVHLGEIETPLGTMGALWWYLVSYVVASGGVWLGSTLLKKAKAGES